MFSKELIKVKNYTSSLFCYVYSSFFFQGPHRKLETSQNKPFPLTIIFKSSFSLSCRIGPVHLKIILIFIFAESVKMLFFSLTLIIKNYFFD